MKPKKLNEEYTNIIFNYRFYFILLLSYRTIDRIFFRYLVLRLKFFCVGVCFVDRYFSFVFLVFFLQINQKRHTITLTWEKKSKSNPIALTRKNSFGIIRILSTHLLESIVFLLATLDRTWKFNFFDFKTRNKLFIFSIANEKQTIHSYFVKYIKFFNVKITRENKNIQHKFVHTQKQFFLLWPNEES